jgi:hypothetical protein
MPLPDTYYPTLVNASYHPNGTGNSNETLSIFMPTGGAPTTGFPVLMRFNLTDWTSTTKSTSITSADGLPFKALQNGIAFVDVSLTVANQTSSSGAYISGYGTFKAPTDIAWTGPFTDAGTLYTYGQSIPEKDAMWAVQGVRQIAYEYNLDVDRVYGYGSGAGANCALFAAYMPERSGHQGFWDCGNTRLNGVIAENPTTWFASCLNSLGVVHFPPSAATHPYNSAAATTLSAASSTHKQSASPLSVAFDLTYNAFVQQNAASQKCYLYGYLPAGGVETTTFNQTSGSAYDNTYAVALNTNFITNTLTTDKSAVGAYTMKKQLTELGVQFGPVGPMCRLVVDPAVATSGSGITYDAVIASTAYASTLASDQLQFLKALINLET